jgi:hypothetical protein
VALALAGHPTEAGIDSRRRRGSQSGGAIAKTGPRPTRDPPGGATATGVAGALAAILVALVVPPAATGGTYTVTQCSASSPTAGAASWERSTDHYRQRTGCGSGDGLQIYHDAPGTASGQYGAWVWRAPAGTVFTRVQANASLTRHAGHRGELVAVRGDGSEVQFGAEHGDFRVHAVAGEFAGFRTWLRCAAPNCGIAAGDSAHAYVKGVFLRTEDRATPDLAGVAGSLVADGVARGTEALALLARDRGGGVRELSVTVNRGEVASDLLNCELAGRFAASPVPCPPTAGTSFALDTAASRFATGPNTLRACAEDLALDGVANRACESQRIWVDNACPESEVGGGAELTARLGRGRGGAIVRSDRSGRVVGRLVDAGGAPVARAEVCVLTRVKLGGAPTVVAATGKTGAAGRYALELPPGPSRRVFVHYVSGDSVIARHELGRLASRARPTLRIAPRHGIENGDRLRFAGKIPGPGCRRRVVKVQARVGPHRWQVFRTDRSGAGCRFAASYSLHATTKTTRYRFRALVPEQGDYPFERGHSTVVARRVSAAH